MMRRRENNLASALVTSYIVGEMTDSRDRPQGVQPGSELAAAWADIEERRRKDPNWDATSDSTYHGPLPAFLQMMTTDAEVEDHLNYLGNREERRRMESQPVPPQAEPPQQSRAEAWMPMPFGQRLRQLRRALGWSQRTASTYLGVSIRTVIRYEQGRTRRPQSAPLVALQRLESAGECLSCLRRIGLAGTKPLL